MKKILAFFLLQFFVFGLIFGATINSKNGYAELSWGSSVQDAKNAGYKLTPMTSAFDKEYLSKLYSVEVDSYNVVPKDKSVAVLNFNYYMGRLFAVTEMLTLKEMNLKKLEARYGKFSDQGIFLVGNQYMDARLGSDGKVSSLSITISKPLENVCTIMNDWNVYKNISFVGQSLAGTGKKTIVEEFESMTNKLIQEKSDGTKASFAFLPFTTDYKNTLVENYVTDALTEAMFNTGSIKIIERSNLEAILSEQKFQASGLVNEETAKSIGMLAGVDFVCYGTLKDVGDGFTVNARVVDVETGEICAMSRGNITKDDYLKEQVQGAVGAKNTSSKTVPTAKKTTPVASNNLWQVSSYRNDFDGFTSYTFTTKSTSGEMFVVNYKKCDIQMNSRVFAGICWIPSKGYGSYQQGSYDFKVDNGTVTTKNLNESWYCYLDLSQKSYYYVGWIDKAGARWLIDLLLQNNIITLRKNNLVRKFQTSGLIEKMAEVGISWEEIDAAMANEEF